MTADLSPTPPEASALVDGLLDSPLVAAGFRELADAVCPPRPVEVRDVEAQ